MGREFEVRNIRRAIGWLLLASPVALYVGVMVAVKGPWYAVAVVVGLFVFLGVTILGAILTR